VSDRVRVVIVDDDPLTRSGLRMLLHGDTIEVVGEAADGAEGCAQAAALRPDVVLMDIRMPGVDGLTATEALRTTSDAPEVIVLTTFDADEHVLRALQAGAAGFLLKHAPPADLVAAVHRVAAGDAQLSPTVLHRLIAIVTAANPRADQARQRLEALTDRERDVANAISEGLSNAEIATRLYLSVPTIKAYASTLFDKLDVRNRVEVAILVHEAADSSSP
jgi:DNA-binding NarL/FixJ family response regulator